MKTNTEEKLKKITQRTKQAYHKKIPSLKNKQ